MLKFIISLTLFTLVILKAEIVYSIQLATFLDKKRAVSSLKNLSKKLDGLFIYKTDSGYWTIRIKKESIREKAKIFRDSSNLKIINKGVVVPSDVSKIDNYQKKKRFKQKVEIKDIRRELPITSFLQNPIEEQKRVQKNIDTYTFHLRVGQRIYVIQFSDNPDSEMANRIFNEKPKVNNLNILIASNSSVRIPLNLGNLDIPQDKLKDIIIPILDKGRRSKNIRIKAYRVKRVRRVQR